MERVMTEGYTKAEDSPLVRMTTAELLEGLAAIVSRVAKGDERVIVSQDGLDVAAVISIEEFWFLERVIEDLEDEMDLEAVREARKEIDEEGTISWKALKAELGL